jgi:hypothetical protein
MHNYEWGDSQFWIAVDRPDVRLFCSPFEHLTGRRWHEVNSSGGWDLDRMLQDHDEALVHSSVYHDDELPRQYPWACENLFFKLNDETFVFIKLDRKNEGALSVWAGRRALARAEHDAWRTKYLIRPKRQRQRKPADFYVLSMTNRGMRTERVPLVGGGLSRDEDLALHYGEDFPAWAKQFLHDLKSRISGASILRGEPGTGKTSFIRHLIHRLRRSHRFYYLPANQSLLLSAPELVGFWLGESRANKLTRVIVIEDAEPLLIPRGRDNQGQLSNLLNISDGLLGELLKIHLICTINCEVGKLDPAVTRGGRLIGCREFRRLNAREAQMLAAARGLTLSPQEDYTLAEIYNGLNTPTIVRASRKLGFAA